jgi:membrane protease YdiL (CAAX protease family)
MNETRKVSRLGLILRVGVFAFLEFTGLLLIAPLLIPVCGYFAAAAMSTFAAAAIANAIALRIWERGQLTDIGLGWTRASRVNLGLGILGGAGAALFVLVPPLLVRAAEFQKDSERSFDGASILFVSVIMLFGALGEEMLFRGYGFQILLARLGPYATILPVSVVFGLAHLNNVSSTTIAILNTIGWGVVFGVAFLRSGDLWLPIGLHFGWNVTLPLFGVNLSGFKMVATGYVMNWMTGPQWSGGEYGPEGGLLTSLVMAPLFWFLFKAPIRRQKAWLLRDMEDYEV